MIDLATYPEQKAKGNVGVAKVGIAYAISARRFDPADGHELQPEMAALAMEDIDINIAEFQTKVDALKLLKADLEALDKV